jgi:hypothetical protein
MATSRLGIVIDSDAGWGTGAALTGSSPPPEEQAASASSAARA